MSCETKSWFDTFPAAADARLVQLHGDEAVIPEGPACYTLLGVDQQADQSLPRIRIKRCPYWAAHPGKPHQMSGYCAKLKTGDWEDDGTILLWDQIKECGINEGDDEDHSIASKPG